MNIALDYDGTYNRDLKLWDEFIFNAVNRGHDIRIVTFRHADFPIEDNPGIPVLYTNGKPKREYCVEVDFFVDIWIDDMPELIYDPN